MMQPLFSASGLARLDAMIAPGTLCVFDFDGTLAPIVAQPDQAGMAGAVRERLQALRRRTPVAILTGRSLADIGTRLNLAVDFLVGNHGLEGLPDSAADHARFLQTNAGWVSALRQTMSVEQHFDPAILIEDKQISVSVHYRHSANPDGTAAALRNLFATLTPAPRIIGGKFVFNLLPEDAGDKGTAIAALIRHSGAANTLYVGDDVTDEDVFRLQRADLLSVRIGQSDASQAGYFVARQADIVQLLDALLARLPLP